MMTNGLQKRKDQRNVIALTGVAALLLGLAAKFVLSVISSSRKRSGLLGSNVFVELSAREILKLADEVITKSKQIYDSVGSVPLDKATYANVIAPLADLEAWQFPLVQSCIFPKLVSCSEDVRKASAEAERRIDSHVFASCSREDVYRVVKAVAAKGERMSPELKRYVTSLVRDFENNGLNLPQAKREQINRLRAQIDDLSQQYVRNLSEDTTYLTSTETELAGVPSEVLKTLDKTDDGKFKIRMRSHLVEVVLQYCKVGTTRKSVAMAYGRRCSGVNLSALESLVELRHKYARLFGYSSYAEYAVNQRMAKTSPKVFEFLEDISASLNDAAARELHVLKDMKRKEEGDATFGVEDLLYYVKLSENEQFDLNFKVLQQYFPSDLVLSGIFKVVQDLFGLKFDEIIDAATWHCDVSLYSVFDLTSSDLLGFIYFDLYAREGKYDQTCVVALQNSALTSSGSRQVPVALLISQLQKGTAENLSLLKFSEVASLFHEFGHLVQHLCNNSSFARFSGLKVDPDFVEIPAMLLENWCYDSASLKLISGFHQDITKPMKEEFCESLKRWRYSFYPLKLKQELLYCLFDQIIHSADNVDTVELFKHLHPKVMLGLPILEGTNPASCFPRSAVGYESSCYSRVWSEVFSDDIFSKFRGNLLNQDVGMEFRKKVLAPGGTRDPVELLTDFLGRAPSIESFVANRCDYNF